MTEEQQTLDFPILEEDHRLWFKAEKLPDLSSTPEILLRKIAEILSISIRNSTEVYLDPFSEVFVGQKVHGPFLKEMAQFLLASGYAVDQPDNLPKETLFDDCHDEFVCGKIWVEGKLVNKGGIDV